ncbi:MAG: DsrE family protein [Candidatus Omnitrophica bacterium]|nr:DsrE family protein [Candidatus Omnitrophota bacterium]
MRDVVRKALLGGVILMGVQMGIPIPSVQAAGLPAAPGAAQAGKYAIILQAGKESHEGMARAVHAFLYAKELKEHGHKVVLIFDGAGTEWAEELSNPESQSQLKPMYDQLKQAGIVEIVCDFCAGAFAVKERLAQRQVPMTAEYAGHPSIAKWADEGYQLVVL